MSPEYGHNGSGEMTPDSCSPEKCYLCKEDAVPSHGIKIVCACVCVHTHIYYDKWMQHPKSEILCCGLQAKARQPRSSKHL